jgi:hypothetical protein
MRTTAEEQQHARREMAWLLEHGYVELEAHEPGFTHVLVQVDVNVWPGSPR